jgi:cytochrome c551
MWGRKPMLLLLVALATTLTGCEIELESCRPDTVDAKSNVFVIYKNTCAGCHGEQMQGISGPDLRHIGSKMSKEALEKVILDGAQGMPGFKEKLTPEQVTLLVETLAKEK